LSALYEVIERDGWTLFLEALEKANRWPLRVRLEGLEGEHPAKFSTGFTPPGWSCSSST
jgi:ribosomal protein S12 methylthiotransferase accessory factor YcaO